MPKKRKWKLRIVEVADRKKKQPQISPNWEIYQGSANLFSDLSEPEVLGRLVEKGKIYPREEF